MVADPTERAANKEVTINYAVGYVTWSQVSSSITNVKVNNATLPVPHTAWPQILKEESPAIPAFYPLGLCTASAASIVGGLPNLASPWQKGLPW
jgi:hypothetical protein